MNKLYYAGIGSRDTPSGICSFMRDIAHALEIKGFILRSGGAKGADQAFQSGVYKNAHIFLPWGNFEEGFQRSHPDHKYRVVGEGDGMAENSVNFYHPAPQTLGRGGRALMRRNYRQIVGDGIANNSSFVICWTVDGQETGGTSQAMRIAKAFEIPIFNLGNSNDYSVISHLLKS